ncbi:CGNR zinc finger domain-containing protein [Micromonospora carbonacea]|uniref:CGNR zinc finger domain-containing protein n=1 Tax=Micromonospora carbonacea TaxID=47853 RepID=A0A7H8XHJ8_9ACTN|nr:CGNR zinc finger domain-containing protein [Micromonospora carbonacea]MBB5828458.1 putative RNA-binding Zn ribbon-like protein [Micromonospora carbonacea]QLD23938.1 CGNR zinc finger domain-containing protein [Micromonospora carbonacea]
MKRQEAPGRLEVVRSFVNTLDLERGVDDLDTVEGLAGWLAAAWSLADLPAGPLQSPALEALSRPGESPRPGGAPRRPGVPPALTEADRRAAVELREALRDTIAGAGAGAGAGAFGLSASGVAAPAPAALDRLNRVAARLPVHLSFADATTPQFVSEHGGVDAVLAGLLGVVAVAALDGTWVRLKMCPAEDCRWVFYDHARNRTGVWCQMAECGNRRKVREHRMRQRTTPTIRT